MALTFCSHAGYSASSSTASGMSQAGSSNLYSLEPRYTKHTSTGRKFALVGGLSHDLESVPDRLIMSIMRGRCATVNYHPVLNLN